MKKFILFSLSFIISETLMANQTPPPPPGGAPPGFPLHSIIYAVALAIGYGIYAVRSKSKK